ncbi:MAG TPA: response regulator, partial [Prolixibacteraceae bacterium]|nr:response regulator [Prolixibacteraceae bacterium]
YFKDKESKFIKVSKSLPKLFNRQKPEDLYGKSDFDFHEKQHAEKAFNDEQKIIKTKKPIIGQVEKEKYEDGRVRYVSTTKMPMFNNKKEVVGTFGISRDITKIKELELEVQERNQALKIQQEELKAINEELKTQEEELRVANEELAEQTKVLTDNEKYLQSQQEELRVTNEELANKTDMLVKQKNEITTKNDNLLKTQNELRKKAKELEQASQYKSEFLANMSHELRTPLNSLLILSKLMGNNKKGNLTDDQVKSIKIINKSGNDLLNLINEILDLSKIEAGKMKYEFTDVVTDDLVSEINQGFKAVAENKNLKLEIEKTEKFPEKIYTDKQRLMQILKNLLSNAFKFTSKGGIKVEFGLPESSVLFVSDKLNQNNTYFISVEDSGVGIPKDKAEAIFEAFQQADGSISRKFGGTGLGLSISKQLTQVLGGEIHVNSVEGEGSVFTVYFPLDKNLVGVEQNNQNTGNTEKEKPLKETETESEEHVKKQAAPPPQLPEFLKDDRNTKSNGLMVLIIHSDKNKAQKLIDLSHKRKFSVLAASSIPDGIKLAEEYKPQAIIISVELSNTKELKLLQENKTTTKLPQHIVSKIDDSVLNDIKEHNAIKAEIKEQSTAGPGNYKEVLIVEDDEATREALQMLFESTDIIIHEATSAKQAYDLISTKPFDSVILDLGLPDYSGKELLKKLKNDGVPIPNVIINTAKELSTEALRELNKYSESIVIKGVKSDERLMDEVTLFLHQVENTLPKQAYPIHKEDIDDEGFKGKKILVVDDDIRNIFAVAQILEEREIQVFEAENGQVAIDLLTQNPGIDLVLMDIMMPVMNGYEAMSEIRKIPELEDIPIITLTAKAMKEDYQKAIDSGANDYIS